MKFRKLKPYEIIQDGDLYQSPQDITPVGHLDPRWYSGDLVSHMEAHNHGYTFWRPVKNEYDNEEEICQTNM